MINDRGDLLRVTFKCCHNLLLILVKHNHILISSTYRNQGGQNQSSNDWYCANYRNG